MGGILTVARLFRLPNLFIVWVTQWLVTYRVLAPALAGQNLTSASDPVDFTLLSAATVLTTLTGYVINDYFDADIDALNKPEKVVVGKVIPPRAARLIYLAGLLLLLLLTLSLAFRQGYWPLVVFPTVALALFLYARFLKCTPLFGNLLVAFLCGLVPLVPLGAELFPADAPHGASFFSPLSDQREAIPHSAFRIPHSIWLFALFAFAGNFFREQVKDLQDAAGDGACGCRTLPVRVGATKARWVAATTGLLLLVMVGSLLDFKRQYGAPFWEYAMGAMLLALPVAWAAWRTATGSANRHFAAASATTKWVMLAGLGLLV